MGNSNSDFANNVIRNLAISEDVHLLFAPELENKAADSKKPAKNQTEKEEIYKTDYEKYIKTWNPGDPLPLIPPGTRLNFCHFGETSLSPTPEPFEIITDTGKVSSKQIEVSGEIDYKVLGRKLRDSVESLLRRAAGARGLWVDDKNKLRCPPGTPAANQFTDITGSNCFIELPGGGPVQTGARAARRAVQGATRAAAETGQRIEQSFDAARATREQIIELGPDRVQQLMAVGGRIAPPISGAMRSPFNILAPQPVVARQPRGFLGRQTTTAKRATKQGRVWTLGIKEQVYRGKRATELADSLDQRIRNPNRPDGLRLPNGDPIGDIREKSAFVKAFSKVFPNVDEDEWAELYDTLIPSNLSWVEKKRMKEGLVSFWQGMLAEAIENPEHARWLTTVQVDPNLDAAFSVDLDAYAPSVTTGGRRASMIANTIQGKNQVYEQGGVHFKMRINPFEFFKQVSRTSGFDKDGRANGVADSLQGEMHYLATHEFGHLAHFSSVMKAIGFDTSNLQKYKLAQTLVPTQGGPQWQRHQAVGAWIIDFRQAKNPLNSPSIDLLIQSAQNLSSRTYTGYRTYTRQDLEKDLSNFHNALAEAIHNNITDTAEERELMRMFAGGKYASGNELETRAEYYAARRLYGGEKNAKIDSVEKFINTVGIIPNYPYTTAQVRQMLNDSGLRTFGVNPQQWNISGRMSTQTNQPTLKTRAIRSAVRSQNRNRNQPSFSISGRMSSGGPEIGVGPKNVSSRQWRDENTLWDDVRFDDGSAPLWAEPAPIELPESITPLMRAQSSNRPSIPMRSISGRMTPNTGPGRDDKLFTAYVADIPYRSDDEIEKEINEIESKPTEFDGNVFGRRIDGERLAALIKEQKARKRNPDRFRNRKPLTEQQRIAHEEGRRRGYEPLYSGLSGMMASNESGKRISEEQQKEIIEDYLAGLSMAQIKKRHGVSRDTVLNIRKKLGIRSRPRGQRSNQRIFDRQLQESIIAEFDNGFGVVDIARFRNIAQDDVSNILKMNGRTNPRTGKRITGQMSNKKEDVPRYPRTPSYGPLLGRANELFDGVKTWEEFKQRYDSTDVVFLDYETTGLVFDEFNRSSGNGMPVQIGAVRVRNGEVVDRFNVFVNPNLPKEKWEDWSRDNLKGPNGEPLTTEFLQTQPSIADAHRQLVEFVGPNAIMGVQNAAFDKNVLEDSLRSANIDWRPDGWIDLKDMASMTLPRYSDENPDGPFKFSKDAGKNVPSNGLKEITKYLGVDLGDKHHNADADAEATAESMRRVIDGAIRNGWSSSVLSRDERENYVRKQQEEFSTEIQKFEAQLAAYKQNGVSGKMENNPKSQNYLAAVRRLSMGSEFGGGTTKDYIRSIPRSRKWSSQTLEGSEKQRLKYRNDFIDAAKNFLTTGEADENPLDSIERNIYKRPLPGTPEYDEAKRAAAIARRSGDPRYIFDDDGLIIGKKQSYIRRYDDPLSPDYIGDQFGGLPKGHSGIKFLGFDSRVINGLDPKFLDYLRDTDKPMLLSDLKQAAIEFHAGIETRPFVNLDTDNILDVLESGIKFNKKSSPITKKYFADIGIHPDSDENVFPVRGQIVHTDTIKAENKETLESHLRRHRLDDDRYDINLVDNSLQKRNRASTEVYGATELLLKNDVEARTAYGNGDAINHHIYPANVRSEDPEVIARALMDSVGKSDIRQENIVELLYGKFKGDFDAYRRDNRKARPEYLRARPGRDALILGGVDPEDIEEMRIPFFDINTRGAANEIIEELDSVKTLNLDEDEMSMISNLANSGNVRRSLPSGLWSRIDNIDDLTDISTDITNLARVRKAQQIKNKAESFGINTLFVNPDGLDVFRAKSFVADAPNSSSSEDALRRKVEKQIKELVTAMREAKKMMTSESDT